MNDSNKGESLVALIFFIIGIAVGFILTTLLQL